MIGAIEAGGTKIMLAVGDAPQALRDITRVPTTTPDETIAAILAFFEARPVQAIGIGSFGPLDVRRGSPGWGRILRTSKPGWSGVDLAGPIARRFAVPIGLDTDVGAAGIAEQRFGAGRDCSVMLYVTVGTGIGGGVIVEGKPLHGLLHPELGHGAIVRHPDDPAPGICPFHGDCLEGLASGSAIAARFGASLDRLGINSEAGRISADYLGQACAQWVLTLSPERIVIGGGVMHVPGLHAAVAMQMQHWLGGYPAIEALGRDGYIVPPALGDQAGLAGAMALGQDALTSHS